MYSEGGILLALASAQQIFFCAGFILVERMGSIELSNARVLLSCGTSGTQYPSGQLVLGVIVQRRVFEWPKLTLKCQPVTRIPIAMTFGFVSCPGFISPNWADVCQRMDEGCGPCSRKYPYLDSGWTIQRLCSGQ